MIRLTIAAVASLGLIIAVPGAADAQQRQKPVTAKTQKAGFDYQACMARKLANGAHARGAARGCSAQQSKRGR